VKLRLIAAEMEQLIMKMELWAYCSGNENLWESTQENIRSVNCSEVENFTLQVMKAHGVVEWRLPLNYPLVKGEGLASRSTRSITVQRQAGTHNRELFGPHRNSGHVEEKYDTCPCQKINR
jgi:hypothetical protein